MTPTFASLREDNTNKNKKTMNPTFMPLWQNNKIRDFLEHGGRLFVAPTFDMNVWKKESNTVARTKLKAIFNRSNTKKNSSSTTTAAVAVERSSVAAASPSLSMEEGAEPPPVQVQTTVPTTPHREDGKRIRDAMQEQYQALTTTVNWNRIELLGQTILFDILTDDVT